MLGVRSGPEHHPGQGLRTGGLSPTRSDSRRRSPTALFSKHAERPKRGVWSIAHLDARESGSARRYTVRGLPLANARAKEDSLGRRAEQRSRMHWATLLGTRYIGNTRDFSHNRAVMILRTRKRSWRDAEMRIAYTALEPDRHRASSAVGTLLCSNVYYGFHISVRCASLLQFADEPKRNSSDIGRPPSGKRKKLYLPLFHMISSMERPIRERGIYLPEISWSR